MMTELTAERARELLSYTRWMHDLTNNHEMRMKCCVRPQEAFLKRVATSGGVSGVVRSTGDLQALLGISGGGDG